MGPVEKKLTQVSLQKNFIRIIINIRAQGAMMGSHDALEEDVNPLILSFLR